MDSDVKKHLKKCHMKYGIDVSEEDFIRTILSVIPVKNELILEKENYKIFYRVAEINGMHIGYEFISAPGDILRGDVDVTSIHEVKDFS